MFHHNFRKYEPIYNIFTIRFQKKHAIYNNNDSRLTLNVLLHCLVKNEDSKLLLI